MRSQGWGEVRLFRPRTRHPPPVEAAKSCGGATVLPQNMWYPSAREKNALRMARGGVVLLQKMEVTRLTSSVVQSSDAAFRYICFPLLIYFWSKPNLTKPATLPAN
jgi:hypothetical protein